MKATRTYNSLSEEWERHLKDSNTKSPSLLRCLVRLYKRDIYITGFLNAVAVGGQIGGPLLLRSLIRYVSDPKEETWRGYLLAVALFLVPLVGAISQQHLFLLLLQAGTRIRTAMSSFVYRKSLTLSNAARQKSTVGQIVTLMSADAQRFVEASVYIHMVWSAPLLIVLALALLLWIIGPSALAGVGVLVLSFPLNGFVIKKLNQVRVTQAAITDERVKCMNEILQGMRVIKFYAWENSFAAKIDEIRTRETRAVRTQAFCRAALTSLLYTIPVFVALVTFVVYSSAHGTMTADKIFTALSLFSIMRFPLTFLPMVFASLIQLNVSIKRLQEFFLLPDMDLSNRNIYPHTDGADVFLRITGGKFQWDSPPPTPPQQTPGASGKNKSSNDGKTGTKGADKVKSAGRGTKSGKRGGSKGTAQPGQAKVVESLVTVVAPESVQKNGKKASVTQPVVMVCRDVEVEGGPDGPGEVVGAAASGKRGMKVVPTTGSDVTGKDTVRHAVVISLDRSESQTESEASAEGGSGGEEKKKDGAGEANVAFKMEGVDISVKQGELVAIVGPVGSGKSSLVSAMLGDMARKAGQVELCGRVAYVAQQPWIVNATLQDNILFGSPYDEQRYHMVVHACALDKDIEVLPAGDLTEIGEKGINLSGGQKQRVSIARAVYNDADIYILDDPLSAVDAHVARHLFDNCVNGLLKDKTRVLVTNQLHFLRDADQIIVLRDGTIEERGSFASLMKDHGVFAQLMTTYGEHDAQAEEQAAEEQEQQASAFDVFKQRTKTMQMYKQDLKIQSSGGKGQLVAQEERQVGKVSWSVYYAYLAAPAGLPYVIFILSLFVVAQAVSLGTDIWLAIWTGNTLQPPRSFGFYVGIYAALGVGYSAIVLVRAIFFAWGSVLAAKKLYMRMFSRVVRAPMSFFDTTPIGRILNRFSKDTDQIDQFLAPSFEQWLAGYAIVIAVVALLCYVFVWFLVALVPILLMFYIIQQFFRCTSRELARLESIAKTPVYAHFSETLSGVSTIRAFSASERFVALNDQRLDEHNDAYYLQQVANRWLGLRLDVLGALIVFSCALLGVITKNGSGSAGWVGLSVTYALQVTQSLSWAVRMSTDTEAKMNSVERVLEYASIPVEAAAIVPDNRPPESWPQAGAVKFEDVQMRYREGLDPVLKGVSFTVQSKEKIGVVGRTGSGKSSLMIALLRLVELCGGTITIDGVDISTIGTEDLRSTIAIIPQDPVLFSGSVRQNLDPFHKASDAEMWRVLELVRLEAFVAGLPHKLDSSVSEGGDNMSVGQRQLICLARALLRKPRILLMDEATANIDIESDALIQQTIRQEFADCTVLTIAHRLNTVMDSDKILVLDNGVVAEFDSPQKLLEDQFGILTGMVDQTGPSSSRHLRRIATQRTLLGSPPSSPRATLSKETESGDLADVILDD